MLEPKIQDSIVHIFKLLSSFVMYVDRVLSEKLRLYKVASVSIGCLEFVNKAKSLRIWQDAMSL